MRYLLINIGSIILRGVGVLFVFGGLVFIGFVGTQGEGFSQIGLGVVIASIAIVMGNGIIRFAKRIHAANVSAQMLARDSRPPILYLRSFYDDAEMAQSPQKEDNSPFTLIFRVNTAEEQLTKALRTVGPVIAIGKPGEKLPPLGAIRIYVDHQDWKQVIMEKAEKARLVIFGAGNSPGVMWEMQFMLNHFSPVKTAILFPPDPNTVEDFQIELERLIGCPLPPVDNSKNKNRIGRLLYFKLNGNPVWKDIISRPPFKYTRLWNALVPVYQLTFQPVFEQLNVQVKAPRIGAGFVLLMLIFSFVGISIIFILLVLVFGGSS